MQLKSIFIGLLVLCGGAGSSFGGYRIHWITNSSAGDSARDRAVFEVGLQMMQAQAAFSSAYYNAQRSLPLNAEIDTAREAVRSAHRGYETAVRETQAKLETRPDIREQITAIHQMERRLDATKDYHAHLDLAAELMQRRSQLSTAEWEVLSVDPDITVAKTEYLQAANTLIGLQQRQASMVLEDEQVAAAKERLDQLRHQLAYRG